MIAISTGVGLFAALVLTRARISALLYRWAPTDPATFATMALVLMASALAGCYIPALRATRVEPDRRAEGGVATTTQLPKTPTPNVSGVKVATHTAEKSGCFGPAKAGHYREGGCFGPAKADSIRRVCDSCCRCSCQSARSSRPLRSSRLRRNLRRPRRYEDA